MTSIVIAIWNFGIQLTEDEAIGTRKNTRPKAAQLRQLLAESVTRHREKPRDPTEIDIKMQLLGEE